MNDNSVYEQEIDLKDLMFAVLHKWKPIILVAILLAVLLGGYKVLTVHSANTNADAIAKAQEDYALTLEIYEMTQAGYEREIADLQLDMDAQNEYLTNSILQQANPYEIAAARADIYINSNYEIMPGMTYQNVDYTESIVQVYQSLLTSNATYLVSPEYNDFRLFLEVCKETGISPLVVNIPVNGLWYDWTEFPKEDRDAYYQNIRNICAEYGVEIADFADKEYEEYFLKDIMHLGWKGWVYLDEAVYNFYKQDMQ